MTFASISDIILIMRTVEYQIITKEQYDGTIPVTRDHKLYQWQTNYKCESAIGEVLHLFNDKNKDNWKYSVDDTKKNVIIALNPRSNEIDYIRVIGFTNSNQQRYHRKNRRDFKVPCMINSESDIIEKLESVDNISGYIKNLIREDIQKLKDIQKLMKKY